ncbi:MAG: tetratricopeptide repeat protein [Chitinophagales bacterium]
MSRIGICILFSLSSVLAFAQNDSTRAPIDSTTFVYANVMYDKGMYDKAIEVYTALLDKKGASEEVYYNLGNCYYRTNKLGPCILNYERALKMSPGDGDVKYNLSLANMRIRDKVDPVQDMILLVWWRDIISICNVHTWAFITILLLWIGGAGFILFRMAEKRNYQRYGFYTFAVCFVLFLFTIIATYSRNHFDTKYRFGVIMQPSAIVKSEPNESSTNLVLIHEGLKVQILRQDANWSEIKMPDGNVGWLLNASFEQV